MALIVDDDPDLRLALRELLESDGLTVGEAPDGKTAIDRLDQGGVDVVLLDLMLPRVSGVDVLRRIADAGLDVGVVIISGHASVRTAVLTTKLGAHDFLEKPIESDRAIAVVREVLALRQSRLRPAPLLDDPSGLIGSSMAMGRLYSQIARAAESDAKVLLVGESGSGKDLTAYAIHRNSRRRAGPFVAVNCAAVPESLVESELFGHEKGAFTGAAARHRGKLEQASGGTLLLDEVGDMSLPMQAKLLRALEEGRLQRVHGEESVALDFRLVCATNCDLTAAVKARAFREDLFYRINVVRIEVPPLRERREDIPELADHLLKSLGQTRPDPTRQFAPAAIGALIAHQWPGNVRELRNVVERLVVLGDGGSIGAREVREAIAVPSGGGEGPEATGLKAARDGLDRAMIVRALAAHGGKIQPAADLLGVNRSHLWRLMKRHGIEVA